MALVCDLEATPYKYLVSIKIKATPATIRTHKPEYEIRTGAGAFVASLRLPSWAVRRGMMHRRVGLMRAKAWPRTGCFCNWMGQSNARKKSDWNHCCFTANHRTHGDMLGISIRCGYLVGIPALIHDKPWTNSRPGRVDAVMDSGSSPRT